MAAMCVHLEAAHARPEGVKPSGPGCVECLKGGGDWVHLRLCLSCGHVGCCDDSPARHATKHALAAKHPVIRSFEPGETWAYCYVDDETADPFPAHHGEAAPRHFEPPAR